MKIINHTKRVLKLFKDSFFLCFNFNSKLKEKFFAFEAGVKTARILLSEMGQIRAPNQNFARGRQISSRLDFLNLIPKNGLVLEIGPFASPLMSGPNVRFCDVLDQAELQKRAISIGKNPDTVPVIDFKLGSGGLESIPIYFDSVVSSHNIEHQPDLVMHLNQIEKILSKNGKFYALIPDKRFCFDRNIASSTIADVLEAHFTEKKIHSLKSIIEHKCLTTHNDPTLHWQTKFQNHEATILPAKVLEAIEVWRQSNNEYVDVHAWYFTPDSLSKIVDLLFHMKLTKMKVLNVFETNFGSNEFWAILEKSDS